MSELNKALAVINEVQKAVVGKNDVIEKIMAAIIAQGHILIEDMPGVGKTTMAKAFSKAMGIKDSRVQFTPDIMPSDLTGFSIYKKETGQFVYKSGALMCNMFLADEINRTSPKNQSALLEVMEERQITVDGITREMGNPFVVIATENPEGSAGTQMLPESQLDRFMICVNMGYPTVEEEMEILKRRQMGNPLEYVNNVISANDIILMEQEVKEVYIKDSVYKYIVQVAESTRNHEMLGGGMSPRGTVALAAMSRAYAWMKGRNFVVPQDVRDVFECIATHRVRLSTKAKVSHINKHDVLSEILRQVPEPAMRR